MSSNLFETAQLSVYTLQPTLLAVCKIHKTHPSDRELEIPLLPFK